MFIFTSMYLSMYLMLCHLIRAHAFQIHFLARQEGLMVSSVICDSHPNELTTLRQIEMERIDMFNYLLIYGVAV